MKFMAQEIFFHIIGIFGISITYLVILVSSFIYFTCEKDKNQIIKNTLCWYTYSVKYCRTPTTLILSLPLALLDTYAFYFRSF